MLTLRNTSITDQQLDSSFSIYNAILPNGTLGRPNRNLLHNGYAQCNVSVYDDWNINKALFTIRPSETDPNNCSFVVVNVSHILASMS